MKHLAEFCVLMTYTMESFELNCFVLKHFNEVYNI